MALVQSRDNFSGGKFCNLHLKMALLHLGPIIFMKMMKKLLIYTIMVCCQLPKTVQGSYIATCLK